MSAGLVKRWRRLAREWGKAAFHAPNSQEHVVCASKAEVFRDCADSLERSLAIQARKARAKGAK